MPATGGKTSPLHRCSESHCSHWPFLLLLHLEFCSCEEPQKKSLLQKLLNPGVYSLPINSRVVDAIAAAGNVLKGADVSDINLARVLKDGEQIYVYAASRGSTSSRSTARTAPPRSSGPIAINRATAKELEALDGIGPVLASRIIAYRNANGPVVTLESLLEVSGIGPAKFAQFKENIRL